MDIEIKILYLGKECGILVILFVICFIIFNDKYDDMNMKKKMWKCCCSSFVFNIILIDIF